VRCAGDSELMQSWTREMEKRLQDRVQTVLCNLLLYRVMQRFGVSVFRCGNKAAV